MIDFKSLSDTYVQNMVKFPALYKELSDQLGVSVTSLSKIEAGCCPLDEYGCWSWTFPERDDGGYIIGVPTRYANGKKLMIPGSKRGLVYAINRSQVDSYSSKQWVRVSSEYPCPLCNKPDGCLYPEGEYDHPNAVICVHIEEGSDRPMELGWLHIFDKTRVPRTSHSLLLPTAHPILIVEGASDVCAGMDIGFTVVGRPSAQGGNKFLRKLLTGREVVIVGENDAGAGKKGMESTFTILRDLCPKCVKLMPPEGIKDLRQWVQAGLTQQELLDYIEKSGNTTLDQNIFEDDVAYGIAKTWLKDENTLDNKLLLRTYRKGFIKFDGHCYQNIPDEIVRGSLYDYLSQKSYIHSDGTIKPYKPNRAKIGDIIDACNAFCPIDRESPSWLTDGDHPDPRRLIVFQNGILDINDYIEGKITLHNPTPDLFSFTVLPYNFDETLESTLWEDFLNDIFNKDEDKISLLAQWFGYNSVPDISYEKLTLFTGRPRSGKSTVLDTLQAMLGDRNCCETSFQLLGNQHGYQSLIGRLSAIIGDAKSPKSGEAEAVLEKILHIVGGDAVSINPKFKDIVPLVRLFCRFSIAMNDLPAFTDHSRALEYRTNILTFDNSYVGREDRTLKHRLREEAASGKLINFALRGLASLYNSNNFIVPEASALAMRTFRELVSPIIQFTENCVVYDEDSPGVDVGYLYELWRWFCTREGRIPGLKSTFIRNILSTLTNAVQIREGEVGNTNRIIMGIRVTKWAEIEHLKG